MYAIIRDGRIVNTGTLEAMFISNVFPDSATPQWLEEHGVYEIVIPPYDPDTQVMESCDPIIVGRTVQLHIVRAKTEEELTQTHPKMDPEGVVMFADTVVTDDIQIEVTNGDSV